MTYLDKKLGDKLVLSAPHRDLRKEEDLFYDSFASVGEGLARMHRVLAFLRKVSDYGPRETMPPRTRKVVG